MPRLDYKWCRACGGHTSNVGPLSHTRLCQGCAISHVQENVVGLAQKRKLALTRWRRGMAASIGAVLLDDVREQP